MDTPSIYPMQLGDIFDKTFKLIGKTFTRNVIILSIILLPVCCMLSVSMYALYSWLGEEIATLQSSSRYTPELTGLFGRYALVFLWGLALWCAMIAAKISVTIVISRELMHQPVTWQEAMRETFTIRFGRAIGQQLLEYLTYGGIFFVLILVIVVGAILDKVLAILFALLGFAGAAALVAFLAVRWSMTIPVIANEQVWVSESFRRSSVLTSVGRWRVLGILLLLVFLTQFAITLLTTPLTMLTMWRFYAEYFKMLGSLGTGAKNVQFSASMLKALGQGAGISLSVTTFLNSLVMPVYFTLLYFDLRTRRGEFLPPVQPQPFDSIPTDPTQPPELPPISPEYYQPPPPPPPAE